MRVRPSPRFSCPHAILPATRVMPRLSTFTAVVMPIVLLAMPARLFAAEAAESVEFERHVRPILKAHCWQCHGEEERARGLARCAAGAVSARWGRLGSGDRAGQPRRKPALPARRRGRDAAGQEETVAQRSRDSSAAGSTAAPRPPEPSPTRWPPATRSPRRNARTGRFSRFAGRRVPVVRHAEPRGHADRRLPAGAAGSARSELRPRGRPRDAHPPLVVRSDRPAADAGGSRAIRRRSGQRRLRAAGRSAAGLARLRRALGTALARRGRLRRQRRLHARRTPSASGPTSIATT